MVNLHFSFASAKLPHTFRVASAIMGEENPEADVFEMGHIMKHVFWYIFVYVCIYMTYFKKLGPWVHAPHRGGSKAEGMRKLGGSTGKKVSSP